MNTELYQQIDQAEKFQGETGTPHVPQDAAAQMGLDWAKRQSDRPPEPPAPQPMRPIVPLA